MPLSVSQFIDRRHIHQDLKYIEKEKIYIGLYYDNDFYYDKKFENLFCQYNDSYGAYKHDTVEDCLIDAKNKNAKVALLFCMGNVVEINFMLMHLHEYNSYSFVSHILEKNKKYRIHSQSMFVDVDDWFNIGCPSISSQIKKGDNVYCITRSAENFHDDYTPISIEGDSNKYQITETNKHEKGSNLLNLFVKNNLKIGIFQDKIRDHKKFLGYSKNHVIEWENRWKDVYITHPTENLKNYVNVVYYKKIDNDSIKYFQFPDLKYVFTIKDYDIKNYNYDTLKTNYKKILNNFYFSQMSSKNKVKTSFEIHKIDTLVSVGNCLNVVHKSALFPWIDNFIIVDISQKQLDVTKFMIQNWNGVGSYVNFCKSDETKNNFLKEYGYEWNFSPENNKANENIINNLNWNTHEIQNAIIRLRLNSKFVLGDIHNYKHTDQAIYYVSNSFYYWPMYFSHSTEEIREKVSEYMTSRECVMFSDEHLFTLCTTENQWI